MANNGNITIPGGLAFRGILPATFDDTLSYYEQIAQLYSKMQELVEYINQLEDIGNDYTDQQIASLRTEIQTQIAEIEGQANSLQSQIDALQDYANTILPDAKKYADDADAGILETANENINQAEQRLQVYINEQASSIQVINFFTGEYMSIQEMFDYLCTLHAQVDSIAYSTINARNYTYSQIRAKQKSYSDLVKEGNTILAAK